MNTTELKGESRRSRRASLAKLREAPLHRKVFAHHPAFNGRWTRRQWAHASVFATLGVLVAALVPGFSAPVAPGPGSNALHSTGTATLALALPALPLAHRHATGDSWQRVTVQRGQTVAALFEDFGIPAATLHKFLAEPEAKHALTHLKPGTELAFDLPAEGQLRSLRFDRDDTHRVELSLAGDDVQQKVIERP